VSDQETTKKVIKVLSNELHQLSPVAQVAIQGSLVQGKQFTEVSDVDLLLLLKDDTESRLAILNQIKLYVAATSGTVATLLNTINSKPVSPTIVTATEFKWGIVKTRYAENFFDTCTYNSLYPEGSTYWSKENLWRYRHEAWKTSNSDLVRTIVNCVKNVQEARGACFSRRIL
jgi:predicted nucleotidyltransferase